MNLPRLIISLLVAISGTGVLCARSIKAIGHVAGENGESIPYATIQIVNKACGTLADADGNFAFTIDQSFKNDTLSFENISVVNC